MKNRRSPISEAKIQEHLKALGGHWVVVDKPYRQPLNIADNDIFKKFEALNWVEENDQVAAAIENYLLSQDLPVFDDHEKLSQYLQSLTHEKYGKS